MIAYLLSLASGSDSVKHKYRQSDMRSHFLICLKEKSPFPLERTMTQVARPDIHISFNTYTLTLIMVASNYGV